MMKGAIKSLLQRVQRMVGFNAAVITKHLCSLEVQLVDVSQKIGDLATAQREGEREIEARISSMLNILHIAEEGSRMLECKLNVQQEAVNSLEKNIFQVMIVTNTIEGLAKLLEAQSKQAALSAQKHLDVSRSSYELLGPVTQRLFHVEALTNAIQELGKTLESQYKQAAVSAQETLDISRRSYELLGCPTEGLANIKVLSDKIQNLALTLDSQNRQAIVSAQEHLDVSHRLHELLGPAIEALADIKELPSTIQNFTKIQNLYNKQATVSAQEHFDVLRRSCELLGSITENLSQAEALANIIEERTRTLEYQNSQATIIAEKHLDVSRNAHELLGTATQRISHAEFLANIIEERSRTLEYQNSQTAHFATQQHDILHKWYIESSPLLDRKDNLFKAFSVASEMHLETLNPIALTSNDHLFPGSTAEGIARPTSFVRNCIDVLGSEFQALDIGSGAGGLVFEFIMNGIAAFGVDGSDYCKRNGIGYWPILTKNLATCDITFPFRIISSQKKCEFEMITAWEVLEHINESDLHKVLGNVFEALAKTGYFLGSISLIEYKDEFGNPYHVTLEKKPWWEKKFKDNGLVMLEKHTFNERYFCRGNGPKFQDFHNYFSNPDDGFHFVAQRAR